jgi:murein DD-endopeptidase MepM/ murein hydrolase activator NlpD
MNRRFGALLAASALLIVAAAALWLFWRPVSPAPPKPLPPIPVSPAPQSQPAARVSTIIDLPGDPALVRRAAVNSPRPIALAVPSSLSSGAPLAEFEAFFVSEPLTPAGGGYLGKFTDNGQQADALNAELAINGGDSSGAGQDMGDDDDGGDATPENAQAAAPLTGANSQQLDAIEGGENGRPQLKEITLRPTLAQKISDLLIVSGYEETSARAVEAYAKQRYNIQTLRVGAVALAVGAVDPSGAYRVAQFAMFQDGEYVGTVALAENGLYGEGAEPSLPADFLDNSEHPPLGAHFNLADGIYSAGLRSAVPEPAIREAVHLLARLTDLDAPLATGETLRLIYAKTPRSKEQPASRVVYAGLSGPAATVDCYAFVMSDGGYRCFNAKEDAGPSIAPNSGQAPVPPQRESPGGGVLVDSGASATGGLLAPVRGAPITSLFGMRFHPILHIVRLHAGIDFGAPVGSQVRAAADGAVESAGEAHGYGDRVVLKHGSFETTYNHLSEIRVQVGQKVRQGEIIALSGNSGLSTGPHLHFEYRINGEPVDPLPHMGKEVQGRAAAVAASDKPAFAGASAPVSAPPDPATLAAFAAAKAQIDAALAAAQ